MNFRDSSEAFRHHGIKGQKWGVRRFQNVDGSLTSAGRSRYEENDGVDGNGDHNSGSGYKLRCNSADESDKELRKVRDLLGIDSAVSLSRHKVSRAFSMREKILSAQRNPKSKAAKKELEEINNKFVKQMSEHSNKTPKNIGEIEDKLRDIGRSVKISDLYDHMESGNKLPSSLDSKTMQKANQYYKSHKANSDDYNRINKEYDDAKVGVAIKSMGYHDTPYARETFNYILNYDTVNRNRMPKRYYW